MKLILRRGSHEFRPDLVAAVDAANRFNRQYYLEFQPILECFQGDRPKIGEDLSTDPRPWRSSKASKTGLMVVISSKQCASKCRRTAAWALP